MKAKFGSRRRPSRLPGPGGRLGRRLSGPGRWGSKSAAAVLAVYGHLEDIPPAAGSGRSRACAARPSCRPRCRANLDLAVLFRRIATVECDAAVGTVDDWLWTGPTRASRRWRPRSACRRWPAGPGWPRHGRGAPGRRTRRLRRRPGDPRHTSGTAEGCRLPALTCFTDARCTGPDRHLTRRVRRTGYPAGDRSGRPVHRRARWADHRPVALPDPGGMRAAESARLESVGQPTVGSNPTPSAVNDPHHVS